MNIGWGLSLVFVTDSRLQCQSPLLSCTAKHPGLRASARRMTMHTAMVHFLEWAMSRLLMEEIPRPTTGWIYKNPCKQWDKLQTSTGYIAGFLVAINSFELLKFLPAVHDILPNEVISFLDAQTLRFMLQEPYHLHELVYFTKLKWGDFEGNPVSTKKLYLFWGAIMWRGYESLKVCKYSICNNIIPYKTWEPQPPASEVGHSEKISPPGVSMCHDCHCGCTGPTQNTAILSGSNANGKLVHDGILMMAF